MCKGLERGGGILCLVRRPCPVWMSGAAGQGCRRAPGEAGERRWGGTVAGGGVWHGGRRQDQICFPSLPLLKFL